MDIRSWAVFKPSVVAAVMLILSVGLLTYSIRSVTHPPLNHSFIQTNDAPILIGASLVLTGDPEFPTRVEISHINIVVGRALIDSLPDGTEKICITDAAIALRVLGRERWIDSSTPTRLVSPDGNVCQPRTRFDQLGPGEYTSFQPGLDFVWEGASLFRDLNPDLYYSYPFEKFNVILSNDVDLAFFGREDRLLATKTVPAAFLLSLPETLRSWSVEVTKTPANDAGNIFGPESARYFTWQRPAIVTHVSGMFLLIMFIVPILIPLLADRSGVLTLSLTSLLGIGVFGGALLYERQTIHGLTGILLINGCILVIVSTILTLFLRSEETLPATKPSAAAKKKKARKKANT